MLCGRVAEHERLSANQSCRIDVAAEGEFVGAKAARASLEIFGLNLVGRLLPGAGYEDAYCGICARLLDAGPDPLLPHPNPMCNFAKSSTERSRLIRRQAV
jgi:hypothetical protein